MKFNLWPWRWMTSMAGAIAVAFSWTATYPHAAMWQIVVAGLCGSIAGRAAYAAISQEIADRKKHARENP